MPNKSNNAAIKTPTMDFQDIREKILNNLLITVSILSLAPLIASIYRAGTIGWQFAMYFQIAFYLAIAATTAFHKKMPYLYKAVISISVCFVLGCVNVVNMGLFGSGTVFLVCAII